MIPIIIIFCFVVVITVIIVSVVEISITSGCCCLFCFIKMIYLDLVVKKQLFKLQREKMSTKRRKEKVTVPVN